MWPFSTLSLEAASFWGDVASWTLVVSLIFGAIATLAIVQTNNAKEHHWDVSRLDSKRHISELENDSARAREHTAELQKQTLSLRKDVATADAKAAEAQLALEKFRAPRVLTAEQQRSITEAARSIGPRSFNIAISQEPEAFALATQIEDAALAAGWTQSASAGEVHITRTGRAGARIAIDTGVSVQIAQSNEADLMPSARALAAAITAAGVPTQVLFSGPMGGNPDIRIVVGTKPR